MSQDKPLKRKGKPKFRVGQVVYAIHDHIYGRIVKGPNALPDGLVWSIDGFGDDGQDCFSFYQSSLRPLTAREAGR